MVCVGGVGGGGGGGQMRLHACLFVGIPTSRNECAPPLNTYMRNSRSQDRPVAKPAGTQAAHAPWRWQSSLLINTGGTCTMEVAEFLAREHRRHMHHGGGEFLAHQHKAACAPWRWQNFLPANSSRPTKSRRLSLDAHGPLLFIVWY